MNVRILIGDCRTLMPAHGPFDLIIAATVEGERARIYGAARNIAKQTNLGAALMVLDATKARLVRALQDKDDWIG